MMDKISITICGDGGCGKSSITLRLVRSQWMHEYDPTIEDSYSVTRTIDGLPYFLSLTDTAGQEEYRGLWAASNLQSDAFLLVYDITNASTLDALDYFMDMIDIEEENRFEENHNAMLRGVKGGKDMKAAPVKIVAGNKCDLKESRVVSSRTGLEWARKRRCGFMETSAREMVNIEETFALIVRRVVEARKLAEQGHGPSSPPLQSHSHSHSHSKPQSPPQAPSGSLLPAFHNNAVSQTQPLTPLAEKSGGGLYDDQTALDRRKPSGDGTGSKILDWFKRLGTCFQ